MAPRKVPIRSDPAQSSQALEFFLSSIRDPHNPRHCGICLDGALAVCTGAERHLFPLKTPDANKFSLKSDSKLWDGILAFVLVKRTDKQMERLVTRLAECQCRMDQQGGAVRRYHELGERQATGSMTRTHMDEYDASEVTTDASTASRTFTKARCAFFVDLFCAMCMPLSVSSISAAAKGSANSWPVSSIDLIPFGADNFVQSMLQWYRFVPDTIILHTIALVLRICQLLVVPSLIRYKFTDAFVQSTRLLVDRTIMDISLENPPPIRTLYRFQMHLVDVLPCFKACMHDVAFDCRAALFRGGETKAMQLCSILLYLSMELRPHLGPTFPNVDIFIFHGHELFRFFHMHMPPRPSMPVHPLIYLADSATFPPPDSCRSPQQTAIITIRSFRREARCSAQGCPNSLQSAGREFQRCGRCGVVSYCGRECQTKAWKQEKYTHKRLCPVLRNLVEKGGGPALFFEGTRPGAGLNVEGKPFLYTTILNNWENACLDDEELALVEDWGKLIEESRGYPMPDGTEWTPGYDDYDKVIATLSAKGRGPKPKYLNRLARWPSEVAKELRMLKLQPFWEQDIGEIYLV